MILHLCWLISHKSVDREENVSWFFFYIFLWKAITCIFTELILHKVALLIKPLFQKRRFLQRQREMILQTFYGIFSVCSKTFMICSKNKKKYGLQNEKKGLQNEKNKRSQAKKCPPTCEMSAYGEYVYSMYVKKSHQRRWQISLLPRPLTPPPPPAPVPWSNAA